MLPPYPNIPLASLVKFEDSLRLYRSIDQLLTRDLAFVTSITNRCIVLELALSTTAGAARTSRRMPTNNKYYLQLISPIYEQRTSGHPMGCDESTLKLLMAKCCSESVEY
jgi:hypothetical protein